MKTMYIGGMYSVQMATEHLKKAVQDGMNMGNSLENILRGLCFDDSDPQLYGEATEDKDKADNSYNNYIDMRFFNNNGIDYCEISCTATEEFTADDDGEWYDGSNYYYNDCLSDKNKAIVLTALGIKEYYFPDDEYVDDIFFGDSPVCIDEGEARRLADEFNMSFRDFMWQMHVADVYEIKEYGV